MPNIPGLRSCYDKVGRLIYFGRMLDKIRLHAAGQLPPDYAREPRRAPVHARRALLPFPRRSLFGDQESHARRRVRRSRPELGARPRHSAHRRRMPRLESLHRQARLARRTQPRPPAAHPGERPNRQTDRNPHRSHRIRRRPRPRRRAGLGKDLKATRALAGRSRTVARVARGDHMASPSGEAAMGKRRNAGAGAAGLSKRAASRNSSSERDRATWPVKPRGSGGASRERNSATRTW